MIALHLLAQVINVNHMTISEFKVLIYRPTKADDTLQSFVKLNVSRLQLAVEQAFA